MSLKDFLKEEREERKARKLEKKMAKKSPKTNEQKYYKIAGIITGVLITFGAIFSSCKNCGGFEFNLNEAVGITDEMIVELKKPVDENLLFIDGKITKDDYNSMIDKLNSVEANIFESDKLIKPTDDFVLNSKEVGSLINGMMSSGDSVYFDILSFKIFYENNYYYEESIVRVNLNDIVQGQDLPIVYVRSTSKVDILSGELCVLSTNLRINMLEEEMNNQIVDILKSYGGFNSVNTMNNMVNLALDLFAKSINTSISFVNDGIGFNV